MSVKSKSELDKLILKKQLERKDAFAKLREKYILDETAKAILELGDDDLISKLQSRSLKASEVLRAFLAKALEVNERVNCVTEFIPQAQHWAENLDNLPEVQGPLHGLPIAIKDDFNIEGLDTTLGYAKNLYNPAQKSAVFVQILMNLGAVPFAKTNVPQSLYSSGSENPIFGKTLNSKNPLLSPGGSSSGSGCIVGSNAAVFATGTDTGGSVRIPAHFNGMATLKPTHRRVSGNGIVQLLPKLVGFVGIPGIIARNAKTLAMVYSEILKDNRQNDLDPRALSIPWNNQIFNSTDKLKIGYFTTLPFFPSIGDTPATVLAAKLALEKLGHELIPFEMPDDYEYMRVINSILQADGGKNLRELFHNEQVAEIVKDLVDSAYTAEWKKRLALTLSLGNKSKRYQVLDKSALEARNSEDLWDKMFEKERITDNVLEKMDSLGVNLILSPVFPFPAIKLDAVPRAFPAIVYTMIWNLVDFPAGTVRFGYESGQHIDTYDDEGDSVLQLVKESVRESTGMPIGVQLIARPYKEELVLRTLVELEKARVD